MILRLGDRGEQVRQAQRQLNKMGSLLDEDGIFGRGCLAAVSSCCGQMGIAPRTEYDDELDGLLRQQPDPLPIVDILAITFIAREEVGSLDLYKTRNASPMFPGGESGITIGIGYDLRFARDRFSADWSKMLSQTSLDALAPWTGRPGNADGARALSAIKVPWLAAWSVFTLVTLPRTLVQVQQSFPGQEVLSPLSRGALLSLVYNRGAAMEGDSRKEMRDIREAILEGRLNDVAPAFLSMKRLWPALPGLQARREREAKLFNSGLARSAP